MSEVSSSNLVAELREDADSYYDQRADSSDLGNVTARLERAAAQEIERLRAALDALVKDEWRVTVDWGDRDERTAILNRCEAALARVTVETTGEQK